MTEHHSHIDANDELNKDHIPEEAWNDTQKVDMGTGTNRYLQMQMSNTLQTINEEVETARETDDPFNTLVVLLARHGTEQGPADTNNDYEEGIERYSTQIGNRDYAIDLAVQFAIESSKEFLSDLLDNNPKMNPEQYRQLEKGTGFNIIKRVIDEFNLKDDDIDLNELKGELSDVVQVTDENGTPLDLN